MTFRTIDAVTLGAAAAVTTVGFVVLAEEIKRKIEESRRGR